jgi:hypothetical protein
MTGFTDFEVLGIKFQIAESTKYNKPFYHVLYNGKSVHELDHHDHVSSVEDAILTFKGKAIENYGDRNIAFRGLVEERWAERRTWKPKAET